MTAPPMRPRQAVLCVLAAAALGGMLFAPVFSAGSLAAPVLAVVVLAFLADEACRQWPALVPARPLLLVVAGLLGVIWTVLAGTTVAGLPSSETLNLLAVGLSESWQLALQSTWPARPDPQLVLFVPLAVLIAATLGVELLHRVRPPLVSLLPSLAVVALSQAYWTLTGGVALAAAVGYAVLAAALLMATRVSAAPRRLVLAGLAVPSVVLGVVGALLLSVASPLGRPPATLRADASAPLQQRTTASPLDDLSARLQDPLTTAFRYTTETPVDRWTLAVLDSFDGVNWTSDWTFRRLGTSLRPDLAVTVPTQA
ncbi:MAG: transglutaminaseTgpA domain-containing protein, partial [Thermocrispum sp.]